LFLCLPIGYAADSSASGAPGSNITTPKISDYVLGVGDKVKITTFGEDDLSGDFQVTSTGSISMPLIGEVKAAGLTMSQLQSVITNKLSEGYMKNPHVSLEVLNYRPFFIVGEVMKPGSYNYVKMACRLLMPSPWRAAIPTEPIKTISGSSMADPMQRKKKLRKARPYSREMLLTCLKDFFDFISRSPPASNIMDEEPESTLI
jgi:hypothetical protein